MKRRHFLRWALLFFVGYFALALVWEGVRRVVLGYPPPGSPDETARWITVNNKDPSKCFKMGAAKFPFPGKILFPFAGMGPSIESQRKSCIREVATIKKDPAVCELLMPSRYGLSCVGVASKPDRCNFYQGQVSWVEDNTAHRLPYGACGERDPRRSSMGNACCLITLVALVRSENDCSMLKGNQSLFDECQHRLSFKNRDPASCASIQDATVRAACVVEAEALRLDPSICAGCKQPVDRIEDLR